MINFEIETHNGPRLLFNVFNSSGTELSVSDMHGVIHLNDYDLKCIIAACEECVKARARKERME